MRQPASPPSHAHPGQEQPGATSRGVAISIVFVLALCVGILAALLLIPGGTQ